jgi:chaperonin GroEL
VAVAPDFDPRVVRTLALEGGLALQIRGEGDALWDQLGDLAVQTRARPCRSEQDLIDATAPVLGRARQIRATWQDLLEPGAVASASVIGGEGEVEEVVAAVDRLKASIEFEQDPRRRDVLQRRMAKLAGGVAVIRVKERTPDGQRARTRTARESIRLVRDAVAEGVLPGAAAALAVAGVHEAFWGAGDPSKQAVARSLGEALREPLRHVAANSGADGELTVRQSIQRWPAFVYEADGGEFTASETSGILDPLSVQRELLAAVRDAALEFLELV